MNINFIKILCSFFLIIFNIKSENIDEDINFEDKYNKVVENIENENNNNIILDTENNNNSNKNIIKDKNIENLEENEDLDNIEHNKLREYNKNDFNIFPKVVINDKFYKTLRLFFSLGFILDPTVKMYPEKLKEEMGDDFEINILSGLRFSIDYIPTNVINKYIGLIRKYRIFGVKLKDSDFFITDGLKNDYSNYIFGIQGEIGISLPINIRYDKLNFDNNNNINKHIHTFNILGGLKFEIGGIDGSTDYIKKVFPTKLVFELMYILDLKKLFSFYISSSFYQCFSPVYLLSFNIKDLQNCLNTSNKFQWNFDITIGLIGINFPT